MPYRSVEKQAINLKVSFGIQQKLDTKHSVAGEFPILRISQRHRGKPTLANER